MKFPLKKYNKPNLDWRRTFLSLDASGSVARVPNELSHLVYEPDVTLNGLELELRHRQRMIGPNQ